MTIQGLPVYGLVPCGECYALRTGMANGSTFFTLFDPDNAPEWIVNGQGPARYAGVEFTVYRARVSEAASLRRRVRLVGGPISA